MLEGNHHTVSLILMAYILGEIVEVCDPVVLVNKLLSFLSFGYSDIVLSATVDVD